MRVVVCLPTLSDRDQFTVLVQRWNDGDSGALDEIFDATYDDLHAIAHRSLAAERDRHAFSTTGLVHEAYIKLSERTGAGWRGRSHFFALASKVMRHLLIDYARRRRTTRHGGDAAHLSLDESRAGVSCGVIESLALDQALDHLQQHDERMARIVECRFFHGMRHSEVAETLGVSKRTVERTWAQARNYLFSVLSEIGPREEDVVRASPSGRHRSASASPDR